MRRKFIIGAMILICTGLGATDGVMDKSSDKEDVSLITKHQRNEKLEFEHQKKEEMKANFEKVKAELRACQNKICKCEVRKKHLKEALENLKIRVQQMEKKYNELDCKKDK